VTANVRFALCSVKEAKELEVVAEGLALTGAHTASISLVRIEDDDAEFAASWGANVETAEPIRIAAPSHLELPIGLYGLAELRLAPSEQSVEQTAGRVRLSEVDYGLQLIEIRSEDALPSDQEQLRSRFEGVMSAREREFASGIGLDDGSPDAREFTALVFVKDCFLTRPMRLGRYEVEPIGGLPASGEVAVIGECLQSLTEDALPAQMAREMAESKRTDHPCFIVRFPVVRAASLSDAAARADAETRVLCSVLSLHRLAYATPFAAFVKDAVSNQCRVWVLGRNYGGNLVGGGISGESPAGIRANVGKAKADERLRLLLDLYREALLETASEAQYFRLWGLIEVMAAYVVTDGEPLLDWEGRPLVSEKGKPLRIGGARQVVFEYMRRTIAAAPVDFNFRTEMDQHTWAQLVSIWYRHRNCMAHQGGCLPDDPSHCRVDDGRYRACKAARDEMAKKHGHPDVDSYRRALREVVRHCVAHELA
jgi:hypothetical protein